MSGRPHGEELPTERRETVLGKSVRWAERIYRRFFPQGPLWFSPQPLRFWLTQFVLSCAVGWIFPSTSVMLISLGVLAMHRLTAKLLRGDWRFKGSSNNLEVSVDTSFRRTTDGIRSLPTGRRLKVTVVEGRNLSARGGSEMSSLFVKLQYGKVFFRTRTVARDVDPRWNQSFEFDEVGGSEYLIKCYTAGIFGHAKIASARLNLEGLIEGSIRDIWVPLENGGELRLQIKAVEVQHVRELQDEITQLEAGSLELILIEARNLFADLSVTADPYVLIQCGNIIRKSKVGHNTLNPQWNQRFEFPDTKSHLVLHVEAHHLSDILSNLGRCVIEYDSLSPNVMLDKWISLQGIQTGEIHVQITKRVNQQYMSIPNGYDIRKSSKAIQMSLKMQDTVKRFRPLIDEGDNAGMLTALDEIENLEEEQRKYMLQLEREKHLLLSKINELVQEINRSTLATAS